MDDDKGFFSLIGDLMQYMIDTQVSLLTIVVLFILYGLREFVGLWIKWRTGQ